MTIQRHDDSHLIINCTKFGPTTSDWTTARTANMCFNESGFCHFADTESLKGNSVLRIEIQCFKSRLHKAQ